MRCSSDVVITTLFYLIWLFARISSSKPFWNSSSGSNWLTTWCDAVSDWGMSIHLLWNESLVRLMWLKCRIWCLPKICLECKKRTFVWYFSSVFRQKLFISENVKYFQVFFTSLFQRTLCGTPNMKTVQNWFTFIFFVKLPPPTAIIYEHMWDKHLDFLHEISRHCCVGES